MNQQTIGKQIFLLRTAKGLTQNELGSRVGVSFQAVSKWERGETLPDISVLPDLAEVLETTIDHILLGGERRIGFRGTIKMQNMIEGILCLKRMGELLGKQNLIYRSAIEGINTSLNTEMEPAFSDERLLEVFVAEAVIQNIQMGFYADITDIQRHFQYAPLREIVCGYAEKHRIV